MSLRVSMDVTKNPTIVDLLELHSARWSNARKSSRIQFSYREFMGDYKSGSVVVQPPENRRKRKQRYKEKEPPIVKAKTLLERIFGSKKYLKDHYFTAGTSITNDNKRDLIEEPSPFQYPDDMDIFSYKLMAQAWNKANRTKEMKLKYNERTNYLSRQHQDILNRLYVELDNVKCNETILDVDPEFYTIVSGRPITMRFNLKEYLITARDILRTRIITGYRKDDALLIEENLLEEQNMIDEITKQYMQYLTSFEEYLANDHETSMMLLRLSETEGNIAYEKYEAYRVVAKELGQLKSQVSNLEEKWRNCKMYQKFLYAVSPMYWRKEYDFDHMVMNKETGQVEIIESTMEIQQGGISEYRSLENIIRDFQTDMLVQREPLLYFKDPNDLNKVFRFVELQTLNSLMHSEELAVPLDNLRENMLLTIEESNKQIEDLKELTSNLEGEILWEEERAVALEALARELINGEFRRLICDDKILNLFVLVEDVYESRVATNDANLSAFEMMRAIEIKYREYLLKLDYMPFDKVHKAEMECYAEQIKIMKVAEEAARKVVQIEQLVKRLRRILEPPVELHTKEVKRRTLLHKPKHHEIAIEKPLTQEEREYFYLFTDFCEGTDDIKEYREMFRKEMEIEEELLKEQRKLIEFGDGESVNDLMAQ